MNILKTFLDDMIALFENHSTAIQAIETIAANAPDFLPGGSVASEVTKIVVDSAEAAISDLESAPAPVDAPVATPIVAVATPIVAGDSNATN